MAHIPHRPADGEAMDSQQVEIVGRNVLVSALVADGLEVAEPLRDHGIDLIAYSDSDRFQAVPIQLKAFRNSAFGVWRKYERFPEMLLVFVWNTEHPADTNIFSLTQAESQGVAEAQGWTSTASWTDKGTYVSTRPSAALRGCLEPFRMAKGSWPERLGL